MKKFIFVLFGLLFLGVGSVNAFTLITDWSACSNSCGAGTRSMTYLTWHEELKTDTKYCIGTSGCNADYERISISTYTTTIFKINKKEYAPGETITASLIFQTAACANTNYLISEFWGETNGVRKTFFPAGWYPIYNPMVSSVNFSAPLISGDYVITLNGGYPITYRVISACTCSDPNNHCSGVIYNDSCGNPVCTGTYACPPGGGGCEDQNYTCSSTGKLTKTGSWWTNQCQNGACSYQLLQSNSPLCFAEEECGTESCMDNAVERERCENNNIYKYQYGKTESCEAGIGVCSETYGECAGTGTTIECQPGYVCKMVDGASHDAECVAKSTTWTEI